MSTRSLSGQALSVLLEGNCLRAARVELGTVTLGATRELPLPPGAVEDGVICDFNAVREALARVLSDADFRKLRRVVFTVCSTQVLAETVLVPPMGKRQLARLLAANTDLYFPTDVSDCRLSWTLLDRTSDADGRDALRVQLRAAPNALLRQYYALANACGMSVAAVDYAGGSLASAVGSQFFGKEKCVNKRDATHNNTALPLAEEASDTLYLLAEPEHLLMTFVRAGKVRLQRLLQRGADGDELNEARLALEYYTAQPENTSRVALILCGSLAQNAEERQRIEHALDLSATVSDGVAGGAWCLCAGAAMASTELGSASLDRHPHQTPARKATQYAALLVGALALVSVLVMNFGARLVWDATLTGLENNRALLQNQLSESAGNARKYREYTDFYNNYAADWDTVLRLTRTGSDGLPLLLEELETVLPKTARVATAAVADEGVGVQFACATKADAAYLILALRGLDTAELIALSDLSRDPNDATGASMLTELGAPERAGENNAPRQSADGSWYFAAALAYRSALAPCERDGLSNADRLERLEVFP